jgi:adenylosuccinate synthase
MSNLFRPLGVHVLVDGQFGSTGKGALASFLAREAAESGAISNFQGVITSAGPNSGHSSYWGQAKIVLKQLPTFAVQAHLMGHTIPVFLSAGAVINPGVLRFEANQYPKIPIHVHPNAVVISEIDMKLEQGGTIRAIASTQSGTGAAIARKILRHPDAVAKNSLRDMPANVVVSLDARRLKPERHAYFMEVSQGFSLGIHSEFYPYVTSRECTVMQGIADARIAPRHVAMTYMCIRTYPIRVGNLGSNSSGDWYNDQFETSWDELGIDPELTTVTQRVRRVASFSMDQYLDAAHANDPDWVAINFMNYLNESYQAELMHNLVHARTMFTKNHEFIGGYGPHASQWRIL